MKEVDSKVPENPVSIVTEKGLLLFFKRVIHLYLYQKDLQFEKVQKMCG